MRIIRIVDGVAVFDGAWVFFMLDTHGLPLEIQAQRLARLGATFDAPTFVAAATKAGWKKSKTLRTLKEAFSILGVLDEKLLAEYYAKLAKYLI